MHWEESMKNRATLENVGSFLLYGTESVCQESSKSQMESAYLTLEQHLQKVCGEEATEEIMNLVSRYNSATELYYFSLGLYQGTRLFHP